VAPGRELEQCRVGGPFHTEGRVDPVERFIRWYNNDRPHRSLDFENMETPAHAFVRKKAPNDAAIREDTKKPERHGRHG